MLKAMWAIDCATLRFNFRGVGNSQGEYDEGRAEARDAEAAVKYIAGLRGMQRGKVILAGSLIRRNGRGKRGHAHARSYHRGRGSAADTGHGVGQLIAFKKRLVVVAGEEQSPLSASATDKVLRNALIGLIRLKIIPGADHFGAGHEEQVTARADRLRCHGACVARPLGETHRRSRRSELAI